jgi:hypothetical protein
MASNKVIISRAVTGAIHKPTMSLHLLVRAAKICRPRAER